MYGSWVRIPAEPQLAAPASPAGAVFLWVYNKNKAAFPTANASPAARGFCQRPASRRARLQKPRAAVNSGMEYLLKSLAQHGALSPAHYWHLRLLSAILLGPLLGILYLVFFGKRRRPPLPTGPTMWVNSKGQLYQARS